MEPMPGDLIVRPALVAGFDIVDVRTNRAVVRNLATMQAALDEAKRWGAQAVWLQTADTHSGPLRDPVLAYRKRVDSRPEPPDRW